MKTIHKDKFKVKEIPKSKGWVTMDVKHSHLDYTIGVDLSPAERTELARMLLEVPIDGTKE